MINLLKNFHLQIFNVKNILELSEEKYFLDDFNAALTKTLHPVGDDLIKLVYQNMGGKRITDSIHKKLSRLINSVSIERSIEVIKELEGKQSSSGIFTTAEELKAYQIIKTILVMNPKLKDHSERIGYKDYKSQFKILVDDMPSKEICNLSLTNTSKKLTIGNETFELDKISTLELRKFRMKLVEMAFKQT